MKNDVFDFEAAWSQVFDCNVTVEVKRLPESKFEPFYQNWPRRRNAKRRYSTLGLDAADDNLFFSLVCKEPEFSTPQRKVSKQKSSQSYIGPLEENTSKKIDVKPNSTQSFNSRIESSLLQTSKACLEDPCNLVVTESAVAPTIQSPHSCNLIPKVIPNLTQDFNLKIENSLPETSKVCLEDHNPVVTETTVAPPIQNSHESTLPPAPNVKIDFNEHVKYETSTSSMLIKEECTSILAAPRLSVKTAAALGMNIAFVDEMVKNYIVFPALVDGTSTSSSYKGSSLIETSNVVKFNDNLDLENVVKLYRRFFTSETQMKIRLVAETLHNIENNMEQCRIKMEEINKRKDTDAKKLMMRVHTQGELKRKIDANYQTLKELFEFLVEKFESKNWELLFQLFFLAVLRVLKILIVSTRYKKGALFKNTSKLLSNWFESAFGKDEQNSRFFNLLKSTTFRDDCVSLVKFLEKYSENKMFKFLLPHASEMNGAKENQKLEHSGHFIHIETVDKSKIKPCGYCFLHPIQETSRETSIPIKKMKSIVQKIQPKSNTNASVLQNTSTRLPDNVNTTSNHTSQTFTNNGQKMAHFIIKLNGPNAAVTLQRTDLPLKGNNVNSEIPTTKSSSLQIPCETGNPISRLETSLKNTEGTADSVQIITSTASRVTGNLGAASGVPVPVCIRQPSMLPSCISMQDTTRRNHQNSVSIEVHNNPSCTPCSLPSQSCSAFPNHIMTPRTYSNIKPKHTSLCTASVNNQPVIPISRSNQVSSTRLTASSIDTNIRSQGAISNQKLWHRVPTVYVPFTPITTSANNQLQQNMEKSESKGFGSSVLFRESWNNENIMPTVINRTTNKNHFNENGVLNVNVAASTNSTMKYMCCNISCSKEANLVCNGCSNTFYCGVDCQDDSVGELFSMYCEAA